MFTTRSGVTPTPLADRGIGLLLALIESSSDTSIELSESDGCYLGRDSHAHCYQGVNRPSGVGGRWMPSEKRSQACHLPYYCHAYAHKWSEEDCERHKAAMVYEKYVSVLEHFAIKLLKRINKAKAKYISQYYYRNYLCYRRIEIERTIIHFSSLPARFGLEAQSSSGASTPT
jgi:hypothetical protein